MKNILEKVQKFQTLIAVVFGSIIIAFAITSNNYFSQKTFVDPDSYFAGKDPQDFEMMFGKKDSNVIVLEYADLDCPFCKKFATENYNKLKENYNKKIGFAYRHLPIVQLHPEADIKSIYALCTVDQDKNAYSTLIHDSYMRDDYNDNASNYLKYLKSKNYDIDKILKCDSDNTYLETLQSNVTEISELGVNGTPTFLVLIKKDNDYQILTTISGARNYDYFSAVIDQAINLAK